ncbi:MAG: hypothetical protein J6W52_12820 [Bacteroidaceae bacterium]|nr:hypothetical protein [Bacteroidaceae bacterium]
MKPNNILNITLTLLLSFSQTVWAQETANDTTDVLNLEWLVSDAESLPIDEGNFIALPESGLFIEDGNTFYALDSIRCPDIVKFRMKAKLEFEYSVISEGDLLVKSHELVVRIHQDETTIVAELDTETFFLHAGTGSKYHLEVLEEDNTWGWYTCDWETGEMTCVIRTPYPISHILDNGNLVLCAIGNQLYTVDEETLQSIAELPDEILDCISTSRGLFMCTTQMLYFYDGNAAPAPILQGDFHSLYCDGEVFYIVLQDGRILKTNL